MRYAMRRRTASPSRPVRSTTSAPATLDEAALAAQGYGLERLDQLVTELLLGVR